MPLIKFGSVYLESLCDEIVHDELVHGGPGYRDPGQFVHPILSKILFFTGLEQLLRCTKTKLIAKTSVMDPDPYWICIQELPGSGYVFGIRIRIHICKYKIKWRQKCKI